MNRGICTVCHRFFEKAHAFQVKCSECDVKDDSDYEKVRAYLELHEGATTYDVITDTGVTYKTLDRFIHERRVYIINNKLKSE